MRSGEKMVLLQYGYLETRILKWLKKQTPGKKFFSNDLSKEMNESPRSIGRALGVLVREEKVKTNGILYGDSKYQYEVIPNGVT
jgi:hypothetical protein